MPELKITISENRNLKVPLEQWGGEKFSMASVGAARSREVLSDMPKEERDLISVDLIQECEIDIERQLGMIIRKLEDKRPKCPQCFGPNNTGKRICDACYHQNVLKGREANSKDVPF